MTSKVIIIPVRVSFAEAQPRSLFQRVSPSTPLPLVNSLSPLTRLLAPPQCVLLSGVLLLGSHYLGQLLTGPGLAWYGTWCFRGTGGLERYGD